MTDKPTIRSLLQPPGPFAAFNREERNAVATLYAALLLPGNLERFAQEVKWDGLANHAQAELFVEWTYLRDLWDLHRDAGQRRLAILAMLDPSARHELEQCSIQKFNAFFGAVPYPSTTDIQSPGSWSVLRFSANIGDAAGFERTCRFKWAFNIKPDLVVQTSADHVLCLEAKWGSVEGVYPTAAAEVEEFKKRGLPRVNQTDLQRYLIEDLLGFTADFRYLVRGGKAKASSHATVTWHDVVKALDLKPLPGFIQTWGAGLSTPP
jgi:hypothetical protein